MEEMHRARCGDRAWSFHASPGTPLHKFTKLEALWTQSFGGFMEASLHRRNWLTHWPLVIDSNYPSPKIRGWDRKFQPPCWAAPHRPASLVVAQPWDQRKSPDTVTETSMAYWTGESYKSEAKSWSDTPLCIADNRQDMVGNFTTPERRRLLFTRGLTSSWLIIYEGNQWLG